MFLEVQHLSKRYGRATALTETSFGAEQGEILALLGPSGCGKTTLLNLIAGFIEPDGGRIRVGGRDLTGVPPNRRNMGMVFQNYALFPHLTVERNVAFGLEAHGVSQREARPRIAEALERVGLGAFARRYPQALSGGQQQRVSLARALVVRPLLLLLDEPLSNLDTQLRRTMQEEIQQILKSAGMTAVLVTHDQEEALVVADRIMLMAGGRIEQAGTPEDVFERPSTVFGARFLEATNLTDGTVSGHDERGVTVATPFGTLVAGGCGLAIGSPVTVMVRPERIRFAAASDRSRENHVDGTVTRTVYLGTRRRLHVTVGDQHLTVDLSAQEDCEAISDVVHFAWRREDTHVLTR